MSPLYVMAAAEALPSETVWTAPGPVATQPSSTGPATAAGVTAANRPSTMASVAMTVAARAL